MDRVKRSIGTCRCQQLSTADSDKTQSQWYKEMYGQINKSPERKKDEQHNPYKPTYAFPDEFDGDLERMENYIRKAASETLDEHDIEEKKIDHTRQVSTVNRDHLSLSSPERTKSNNNNNNTASSSITINPTRPSDDDHRSMYKKILRGGDIPSTGLQKLSLSNREFRWHVELPSGLNKTKKLPQKSNDQDLPISKACALHNFHGQSDRELSFKKDDIILVKRRINDDWLEGEWQGKTGIFPVNHVELFPYETNEGEAIVKYDFFPQKTSELQLRKGDRVVLLRKLDSNWYEGRVNQKDGIFPADYVEIIREPKDHSSNSIPKSVLKTSSGSSLPRQKCQVLYDYTPQNADELEIHVGDILSIIEMCDDGWYCGVLEKSDSGTTPVFGTFPGNYVQILPI